MNFTRHFQYLFCSAVALLGLLDTEQAQAQYSEYEIKASLIRTVMRYTVWDEDSFDKSGKIILTIYGSDPFGDSIDELFKGDTINNRSVVIRRTSNLKELKGSHAIFISRSEEDEICRITNYINSFRRNAVLTFGDRIPEFCERGGIVKIHSSFAYFYALNLEAASDVGLVLDSRVIGTAEKFVKTDPDLCQ